jgi:hypothetical protein
VVRIHQESDKCIIVGTPDAVARVEEALRLSQTDTPGEGEIAATLACPRRLVGRLVGKAGANVKRIIGDFTLSLTHSLNHSRAHTLCAL